MRSGPATRAWRSSPRARSRPRRTESPDPAAAAIWGLVRSAQSEHPGRFALIDTRRQRGLARGPAGGPRAATSPSSPCARARRSVAAGRAHARRGRRASPLALDPERTVLITGATGALGALLARHLVEAHGARHLLLASRSRPEAAGRQPSSRPSWRSSAPRSRSPPATSPIATQLEALLAAIDPEHPLGAVIHAAGVLDDGLIEALDPEQPATASSPPRSTPPGTCTS